MDNVIDRYPVETLSEYDDCGTMPENVDTLREAVIGRKIVRAFQVPTGNRWRGGNDLVLELDNGTQVKLANTDDCCASTELESFFLDPASVDHAILGVGTTGDFTKWHIYADFGDVMQLEVGWSCGNPFYYGYGFGILVEPITIDAEVVQVVAEDQRAIES